MSPFPCLSFPRVSLPSSVVSRVSLPSSAVSRVSLPSSVVSPRLPSLVSLCLASLVSVDEQAGGADAQHDVDALGVFGRVQVDAVHSQLLGVLQVVHLRLGRRLAPAHTPDAVRPAQPGSGPHQARSDQHSPAQGHTRHGQTSTARPRATPGQHSQHRAPGVINRQQTTSASNGQHSSGKVNTQHRQTARYKATNTNQ